MLSFCLGRLSADRASEPSNDPAAGPHMPSTRPLDGSRSMRGLVLSNRGAFRENQIVEILARSTRPSAPSGGQANYEFLISTVDGTPTWLHGDVLAVEPPRTESAAVFLSSSNYDFDGDGNRDETYYVEQENYHSETMRASTRGWLVFEGSTGVRALPVTSDDGWGTNTVVEMARATDLVGDHFPDYLIVLRDSLSEVGFESRRALVVSFMDGSPHIEFDQPVRTPAQNGLGSLEIGSIVLAQHEIVARTVVHRRCDDAVGPDRLAGDLYCLHTRVDTWRRQENGFAHERRTEPVHTDMGGRVTHLRGPPPGVEGAERLFRVVDAGVTGWVRMPRFSAELRYGDAFLDAAATESSSLERWVELVPPQIL